MKKLLILAEQMLKEQNAIKHQTDYEQGVCRGIERIVKLIKRKIEKKASNSKFDKIYTITITEIDGKVNIIRDNRSFTSFQLLGFLSYIHTDIASFIKDCMKIEVENHTNTNAVKITKLNDFK